MSTVADERRNGVKLIEIDESQLRGHVDGVVREADELYDGKKYERWPERDYRAGRRSSQLVVPRQGRRSRVEDAEVAAVNYAAGFPRAEYSE